MIESAKPVADAHPGVVSLVLGDAEKLPVPDASFDAVVMGFIRTSTPAHPNGASARAPAAALVKDAHTIHAEPVIP